MVAAVDLDEHLQPRYGRRQQGGPVRRVDPDPQPHPLRQRAQPSGARTGGHHRVGEEHVVETRGGEHLRLGDGRERQATVGQRDLAARDLHALVRLRVRPQGQPAGSGRPRHRGEVAVEEGDVDGQVRGVAHRPTVRGPTRQ